MKGILKYLRQTNFLTQDEIAQKLEISRQWYIKIENGTAEPSAEIMRKLTEIYDVSEDFIRQNKIPKIPERFENEESSMEKTENEKFSETNGKANPNVEFEITSPSYLAVAEPSPAFSAEAKPKNSAKMYFAFFDGKNVQIQNPPKFKKGEHFKIYIEENEQEDLEERKKSFKKIMEIVKKTAKEKPIDSILKYKGCIKDDNFDWKEELSEALEEKYGITN